MSPDGYSASWTDPDYVSTVVGVLAAGALYFYSAWVNWGPTTVEITVVLLAVLLPTTLAYEIARRF
ncbi:hypothetical protein BG842_08170 [Haladaptatus sp. W1]|uniref:hypothetical protein n=1 Tax=Haladaptatus sp. W1 TaxID=1897478 RepID=UPI000849E6BA|nr:hypothetical protein [Haladaptatus sp. W1]ODR79103.1 hypothetical protein BG842_08170 [Haladaptatus sp. W1]